MLKNKRQFAFIVCFEDIAEIAWHFKIVCQFLCSHSNKRNRHELNFHVYTLFVQDRVLLNIDILMQIIIEEY